MVVRGEKLGGDMQIGHLVHYGLGGEPFFLRAVESVQLCWVNVKGFHVRLVISAYISCVSSFSYKMYINLNHCNSRISVTACLVAAIK
jgi:hypothetical protein